MDAKLMLEIITMILAVGALVFTAGGFYIYVPKELARQREDLARVQKDLEGKAAEIHGGLEKRIDKNFETLDDKIKEKEEKLRTDLSGIGNKVSRNHEVVEEKIRSNEKNAARRYHNLTEAVLIAAPEELEKTISKLLKEEAT